MLVLYYFCGESTRSQGKLLGLARTVYLHRIFGSFPAKNTVFASYNYSWPTLQVINIYKQLASLVGLVVAGRVNSESLKLFAAATAVLTDNFLLSVLPSTRIMVQGLTGWMNHGSLITPSLLLLCLATLVSMPAVLRLAG